MVAGAPPAVSAVDGAAGAECSSANSAFADTWAYARTLDHGTAYSPLDASRFSAVEDAMRLLAEGDVGAAKRAASEAGFIVDGIRIAGECLLRLAPAAGSSAGQGVALLRAAPARDLILEAPHVPSDGHTDEEGGRLFDLLGARAFVIAGAKRCASDTPTSCHRNPECRSDGQAVESDVSHSTSSAFHAMHVGLDRAVTSRATVFLQLHTNLNPTANGDLRVSNGTRSASNAGVVASLTSAWRASGVDARSCNEAGGLTNNALCGVTNAQSLSSNGVDACTGTAALASGRFIHLEQYSRMLDSTAEWTSVIAEGLRGVLPTR